MSRKAKTDEEIAVKLNTLIAANSSLRQGFFYNDNGNLISSKTSAVTDIKRVLKYISDNPLPERPPDDMKLERDILVARVYEALQTIISSEAKNENENKAKRSADNMYRDNKVMFENQFKTDEEISLENEASLDKLSILIARVLVSNPTSSASKKKTKPRVGEEEEEEEVTARPQNPIVVLGDSPEDQLKLAASDPLNLGLVESLIVKDLAATNVDVEAVNVELGPEGEIVQSIEQGTGNFLETSAFIVNRDGTSLQVKPREEYAPYTEYKRELDFLAAFLQQRLTIMEDASGQLSRERMEMEIGGFVNEDDIAGNNFQTMAEQFPGLGEAPVPGQAPVVPVADPLADPLADPALNQPEIMPPVPIGNTLDPLAAEPTADQFQEGGSQVAVPTPPTKFKPKYHVDSIELFFGDAEKPAWDLQLERSITELTWGKEGFNRAMDGLILKHSMDFFIWERKSDGTQEEFNEICQVYFCFLRQLQRGSRAPTANVPLSSLIGFGNKLAQAAGGFGEASLTTGGGRSVQNGPFSGASPYTATKSKPGDKPSGPFAGVSPYTVDKKAKSSVKNTAMLEAQQLSRISENEAVSKVVEEFDKRQKDWKNKPFANEYIVEAAARLPKGDLQGTGDPKDPTGAFQYGIATKRAINIKIREEEPIKISRHL